MRFPLRLVVWAIVLYRRPLFSGAMLGLAFGTIYYPMFLLPLWISFYWRRGLFRFLLGFFAMVGVLVVTLAFTSSDMAMFLARLQQMFGIQFPVGEHLRGAWQFWNEVYRYPILAAFIGLCISFVLWPAQKNLATLLSCSAAIMLGTQFWHAYGGGSGAGLVSAAAAAHGIPAEPRRPGRDECRETFKATGAGKLAVRPAH